MSNRSPEGRVIFNDMVQNRPVAVFTRSAIVAWIKKRWPKTLPTLSSIYIIEFSKNKQEFVCDIEIAIGMDTWSASCRAESILWAFKRCFANLKREVNSENLFWTEELRNSGRKQLLA